MKDMSMKKPLMLVMVGLLMATPKTSGLRPPAGSADQALHPRHGSCRTTSPIEYGLCALRRVQAEVGNHSRIQVSLAGDPAGQDALDAAGASVDPRPESFVALPVGRHATMVVGRDATGAMYGLLELAERLQRFGRGSLPPREPFEGTPAVPIRAANLFLVLPAPGESTWWFLDEEFWREYLDLLARSRMNFLDLHGMYNLGNTIFPNALLYFATSETFPAVGIDADARAQNLAMLNRIIELAAIRGIQVGLMTYRSDTRPTGDGSPQLPDGSDDLKQYIYEAAKDLATRASGLSKLGFRIGESGQPASFYIDTFIAGVEDAGTGVGISTRTWGTSKTSILTIADRAGPDTIVEAKYNGEHLAAPYAIAGGRFSSAWKNYSYESYLNPPAPYLFVFQVRAGGTHRAFRYTSYERTRRTVLNLLMSELIEGFTLEAAHAYFPQRDPFHAPDDQFSPWTFRRDELSYLLFGRLAYDPSTPPDVFRLALQDRVGTDDLWDPVQAAGDIVPWIQTAHTCGPDQRNYAPELELGGHVAYWASPSNGPRPSHSCGSAHQPFDQFAIALPDDIANDVVEGRATSRLSPLDVARIVLDDARRARAAADVAIDPGNPEARDVVRECQALADLGEWFAHKLRSASTLAVYEKTGDRDYLDAARAETDAAGQAWMALANDTSYLLPFVENLRMRPLGVSPFHWSLPEVLRRLGEDPTSIDAVEADVTARSPQVAGRAARTGGHGEPGTGNPAAIGWTLPAPFDWLDTPRDPGPGLVALEITPADPSAPEWSVTATLGDTLPDGSVVNVLWKPFSGTADWRSLPASRIGNGGPVYQATIDGGGQGGMFAIEILGTRLGWRYPYVVQETPYRTLSP
jgi:hypothetical protein